jgi:hypothetical protein
MKQLFLIELISSNGFWQCEFMSWNIHPLLAKRDQKAILARIQGLMKRDGLARSLS